MKTQYSYCSFKGDVEKGLCWIRFLDTPYNDFESCLTHAKSYLQVNEGVEKVLIVKDVALVTPKRPIPKDVYTVEMCRPENSKIYRHWCSLDIVFHRNQNATWANVMGTPKGSFCVLCQGHFYGTICPTNHKVQEGSEPAVVIKEIALLQKLT